jgi:hypothetical protein
MAELCGKGHDKMGTRKDGRSAHTHKGHVGDQYHLGGRSRWILMTCSSCVI